jgi:Amt family ammonium transporter
MSRLTSPLRDRSQRRLFAVILAGKVLGLAVVLAGAWVLSVLLGDVAGASAQADAPASPTETINAVNTVWVLLAASLVFFMQAGFMMLEAGFARTRETVNVLLECIVDTAICGLLFFAFGFAFMFGTGNGFIGHEFFFLQSIPDTYGTTGVPFLAFFLFQFAFADTASTVTSGAMIGRTRFSGDIWYSIAVSGFIYPILGHWVWGPDGWLATMDTPFRDFAGSTVVHTVGGIIALCGAIALGPRLGRKFKRDGGGPTVAHNMTLAAVGGVILWFGWYGFNPGSTLSALDAQGIGRVATNTTLAACAGVLVALTVMWFRTKTYDTGSSINGFLAGLVAVTAPCYWVSPVGAIIIGGAAAAIMLIGLEVLEWFRVDDPVGAFAVHGAAGIWGTLAVGLFATGAYGLPSQGGADTSSTVTGLFYGGGFTQLGSQVLGSLAVTAATLTVGLAVMYALRATRHLRLDEASELAGIDVSEHGGNAYPELPDLSMTPVSANGHSRRPLDVHDLSDLAQPEPMSGPTV